MATHIVHAASEAMPWSHTGGLAEVAAALPAALQGVQIAGEPAQLTVVLPLYRATFRYAANHGRELEDSGVAGSMSLDGQEFAWRIWRWQGPDGPLWAFVDCPRLFDRDGLYDGPGQVAYGDNPLRYAFFCRVVLAALPRLLGEAPAILHAHDWQTALLPLWLKTERPEGWQRCRSVFTIHNLAYQGVHHKSWLPRLGLPWHLFHADGIEYWDHLNLLKAGIGFADALTTVSPGYAQEILGPASGEGLDGLLRAHKGKLEGILNGIDEQAWNPATDAHLAARYDADDLCGKALCRTALLEEMGLAAHRGQPVFGIVARFAWQKGLDLVAECAPGLVHHDARLVVLGSGDPDLEGHFKDLAARYPNHVAVRVGFNVGLAHRIEAGADAFLMPSRYEPCGLNQMFSMAYGTVPVVHATGGLRDTVVHTTEATLADQSATGFAFEVPDATGLGWAMEQTTRLFRQRPHDWERLMRNGMSRDWSWARSATRYGRLYEGLIGG